jgi:hypothetical protein
VKTVILATSSTAVCVDEKLYAFNFVQVVRMLWMLLLFMTAIAKVEFRASMAGPHSTHDVLLTLLIRTRATSLVFVFETGIVKVRQLDFFSMFVDL